MQIMDWWACLSFSLPIKYLKDIRIWKGYGLFKTLSHRAALIFI